MNLRSPLPALVVPAAVLAVAALSGCGSASKPAAEPVSTTSAPLTPESGVAESGGASAAEAWAEAKVAKETQSASGVKPAASAGESLDPLSEGEALEAASIPKVEVTDRKQVRGKTRGELDAALSVMKTATTVDEAAAKLTARIGKPSWTENGQRRVWIAMESARCHRLVLDADGSAEVETKAKTDVLRLTATARQNPCTGEIERGGTR